MSMARQEDGGKNVVVVASGGGGGGGGRPDGDRVHVNTCRKDGNTSL